MTQLVHVSFVVLKYFSLLRQSTTFFKIRIPNLVENGYNCSQNMELTWLYDCKRI